MHARGIDPEMPVDDDSVERGDRVARMETRSGRSDV